MVADLSFSQTVVLVNTIELLFVFSTSINHECTRYRDVTVIEFAFIRNAFNLLCQAIELVYYGIHPYDGFTRDKLPTLMLRLIIGNLTYICFTATYKLLPLGIGATIIAMNPFLIAILQAFLLADRPKLIEVAAIVISFIGIVIMSTGHKIDPLDPEMLSHYLFGILIAVATATGMAFSTITSRMLKGFNTTALMFNHMLFGTALAGALFYFDKKPTPYFVYEKQSTYLLLLISGLANNFAMSYLQFAWQNCRSSEVAMLRYVSVIYNFAMDLTVFDESFTQTQIMGAGLVLVTNVVVIIIKARHERQAAYAAMKDEVKSAEVELPETKQ
jgi:drug/metabolite transporter (DMT)-like permease